MDKLVLPKRISNRLRGFEGATAEDKINYLTERAAIANLGECNECISRFESRYGRTFTDFETAWSRGEIANPHAYHVETDFIEWEALEQEKVHWLSVTGENNV